MNVVTGSADIKYTWYFFCLVIKRIGSILCATFCIVCKYRGADKSLARQVKKQATTEDFDFHISYL